jgi:hypothetical protein
MLKPTGCSAVHKPINHKSQIEEFMTVLLHAGDEKKLHDCFNATVPSLMIGQ